VIAKPYGVPAFDGNRYDKMRLAFGVAKEVQGNNFDTDIVDVIPEKKAKKLLIKFSAELRKLVAKNFISYDDLEVPQDFIDARKQERLSKEILETTIPVKVAGNYGRGDRVMIQSLIDFKGRIYYGVNDEANKVAMGRRYFEAMFTDKHVSGTWEMRRGGKVAKGILFCTVSKANEKYLKMCSNALHIDYLYPTMLRRKMVNPANIAKANSYISKYSELEDSIYVNKTFDVINKVTCDYHNEVKQEIDSLKSFENYSLIDFDHPLIKKWFDTTNAKSDLVLKTERKLNYLLEVQEKNKEILKWVDMPWHIHNNTLREERYNGLVELLKKVLVF
jgi:hypothetical protein